MKAIAIRELEDKSHLVPVRYGCEIACEPISNVYIKLLTKEGKKYGLTPKDSMQLDSVLLYTPNLKHIDYLNNLLEVLPPHQAYYQRIKELFLKDHNLYALRALARYKKPEDYNFILSALHGKVENPIDLEKFDENVKWANDHHIQMPKFYSIHDTWQYEPDIDSYNRPHIVKDVALECVYECPAPIFKKYANAAKRHHDEKMAILAFLQEE